MAGCGRKCRLNLLVKLRVRERSGGGRAHHARYLVVDHSALLLLPRPKGVAQALVRLLHRVQAFLCVGGGGFVASGGGG
jgi:hypothetical protein